jgi:hypothetical protein
MLIMQRPLVAAVTGLWAMCTAVFVLGYAIGDWETLLMPLWFLLGLWGVVGIDRCAGFLSSRARWVPVLIAITLPVIALASGYADADRSSIDPQADVDAALAVVPDNSIIFTYDNGTDTSSGIASCLATWEPAATCGQPWALTRSTGATVSVRSCSIAPRHQDYGLGQPRSRLPALAFPPTSTPTSSAQPMRSRCADRACRSRTTAISSFVFAAPPREHAWLCIIPCE